MKKELRRDPNNKIIAGVCSGIANYLDIDPVIIRLIWAAAIFLFIDGTSLSLYRVQDTTKKLRLCDIEKQKLLFQKSKGQCFT